MATEEPRYGPNIVIGCAFAFPVLAILVLLFPGLVFMPLMAWVNGQPDPRTDTDFIWQAMSAGGLGFGEVEVIKREGSYGPQPGLIVDFRIALDTSEGPLKCSGTMQAFRGDPGYLGITWQEPACTEAIRIVQLAQGALNDAEAGTHIDSDDMDATIAVLGYWVEQEKIRLEDIKDQTLQDRVR